MVHYASRIEWRDAAVCATGSPGLWLAQAGTPEAEQAKALCAACPAMLPCRFYALTHHETGGVWGGLDDAERDALNGYEPDRSSQCRGCGTPIELSPRAVSVLLDRFEMSGVDLCEDCRRRRKREREERSAVADVPKCRNCGAEGSWLLTKCGACTVSRSVAEIKHLLW